MKWSLNPEPETTTEYAGTKLGQYYTDPDTMLQTELSSAQVFHDLYGYGSPEISSINVNCLFYAVACILGARIIFPEDDSPQIEGRAIEKLSDIRGLRVPEDVTSVGYLRDFVQSYEHLKRREANTGVAPVFSIPGQSPLGTATVLRGSEIFLDIMTEPEAVKDLLEIVTETAIRVIAFQEEFTGRKTEAVGMDDDYGGMVSPETYEEFNYPYIKRMYDAFQPRERFLHSESLSSGHLRFIRELRITEFDSWPYADLTVEHVGEALPDTYFTWNPETTGDLYADTPEEIRAKFIHAVHAGAPGMNLTLCARRIPRESIRAFIEAGREMDTSHGLDDQTPQV